MPNVHEFFKTCILTISCLIAYYEFFPLIKNASCTSSFPYQISILILRKVPIFFQKRTKNFACLFNCKHNSTHILKPNTYNSALFTKKAPLYNGTSSYPIYSKSSLSPEVLSHWQSAISFLFILLASVDCLQTIQFWLPQSCAALQLISSVSHHSHYAISPGFPVYLKRSLFASPLTNIITRYLLLLHNYSQLSAGILSQTLLSFHICLSYVTPFHFLNVAPEVIFSSGLLID